MKHMLRRRDTEALIDGIVDGDPTNGSAGLEDVEAFLSEMRTEFGAAPAPAPRPTLASTLDGRRPLRPASSGPRTKPTIPEPRPRQRLFRPVAVGFAASALVFGGLASAGALPGPVQRGTAELTSHVGIHLPGAPANPTAPAPPDDRVEPDPDVPRAGTDDTSATSRPDASTPPTSAPSTSVVPTPSTAPVIPNPPTTPEVPLPLPLPRLRDLLEPLAGPGLTGPSTGSGVLPTDLIP